jgi:hypothetical protein
LFSFCPEILQRISTFFIAFALAFVEGYELISLSPRLREGFFRFFFFVSLSPRALSRILKFLVLL